MRQQREELFLHGSLLAQARQQRSYNETLLGLPHIFPCGGQFESQLDEASKMTLFDLAACLCDKPCGHVFQHHRLQCETPPWFPSLNQRAAAQRLQGFEHLGTWQGYAQHSQ